MAKRRNQPVIELRAVIDEESRSARIRTHGMYELGFPELEIRGVPEKQVRFWANLVNDIAEDIRVRHTAGIDVRVGESLSRDDVTVIVRRSSSKKSEDGREAVPVWVLEVVDAPPLRRTRRGTRK